MQVWLALITIQVLFGVNYVVSKIVIGAFPPMIWAAIRIWIATVFLIGFAKLFSKTPSPRGKEFFVPLLGFALLGAIINQACFLFGLKYTTATNSALINALIPVFTLFISVVMGKERGTPFRILGFACAFGGVLLVRKVELITFEDRTWLGDMLTLLNVISFALFLNLSRDFVKKFDALWCTAWMFAYGSVGLGLLSIPSWSGFVWPEPDPALIAAAAYSILGGTIITYVLNFWALARAQSSVVALFIYLQPVVASVTAWVWLGETITLRTVLSSLLVLAGLWLAMVRGKNA